MTASRQLAALCLIAAFTSTTSVSAQTRGQNVSDVNHAAYCLAYIELSGPTAAQLADPSVRDPSIQAIISQHQAIIDRLANYVKANSDKSDKNSLRAQRELASNDFTTMAASRSVTPNDLANNPSVQRVLSCTRYTTQN